MAWEKERRHLNKQTPERVSFVEWPRAGISVLIRRFPVVFEKTEEQSAIDFLGQYGDPAAVAPSTTVENPVAGGKAYPGVFRSVKVETGKIKGREETQGIYQTLVTGSFRETGWVRVENNCQYVVDQEIYWSTDVRPPLPANSPGVEYSYAQQSYDRDTGLYVVIIERRTRLYQYDSRVSEISPLSTTETTQQLGVTSQSVAPLLDERGVLARRTTSLNRDCSKDLVTETDRARPFGPFIDLHGGALVRESVSLLANQLNPPSPGPGGLGVLIDVSPSINRYGLIDSQETRRTAVPFGPWSSVHGGPLVRETVVGDLNQAAALSPGAGGVGLQIDVSQNANPFGLYDRTQTTRQAIPFGPWASTHGSPLVEEMVQGDLNQAAPLSPGAGGAGYQVDVSQGANPFGLYDRTLTRRRALPFGPWLSTHGGALVRETVQGDLNQPAPLNPGPGGAGITIDVSQGANPFGLYDRTMTTRQAIAFGPWTSTHGGPVVEETVEGDLNQPTALNPGAGATGTTIDVSQSVNPFGLYDRQKTTRRARPFNWSFNAGGPIYRESVSGFLNGPAAQSPGPGGTGVVTDVNQSLNAFGLYDGAVITRTALPFGPWTSVHGGPLVEETVEGAMNQPSALSPGAGAAGFTIDVSQNANSYGLYDRTKTQRRAIPFGPWSSVHGSPLVRETVEGALNQPSAISPGAGAAGISIDVSQSVNPFGLYDRVKTTREAQPADTGWIATTEDTGFRSESRSFRNKTLAEVQAIASTIGGVYRGRCFAHYNDFGLLDGTATRMPKVITLAGFDTPASLSYAVKYEKPRDGYSYNVSEKITSSPSLAASHANNTMSHLGAISGGVRFLGSGIYKSVHIG